MPPTDGSSVGAIAGRILAAIDASPPPVELVAPMTDFAKAAASMAPGEGAGCQHGTGLVGGFFGGGGGGGAGVTLA
jgi:hypothetical protein